MSKRAWIVVIGAALLLLAVGGWTVDAVRWSLASLRTPWKLAAANA